MLFKGISINKTDDDLLLERVACELALLFNAKSGSNKKLKIRSKK